MDSHLNNDAPGYKTSGGPIPGLEHDEAAQASEVVANVMIAGLKHADQELIAHLRATDPEFGKLDRQISEHLTKIHDVGEGPSLDSTFRPDSGRTRRKRPRSRKGADARLAAIQWTLDGVTTLLLEASIQAISLWIGEFSKEVSSRSPVIARLIMPLCPIIDQSDPPCSAEDVFELATSAGPKIVIEGASRRNGLSGCSVILTNDIISGTDEFIGSDPQPRVVIIGEKAAEIPCRATDGSSQRVVVGYLARDGNSAVIPDCLQITNSSFQPLDDVLELLWTMGAFVEQVARQAPKRLWDKQISPSLLTDGMQLLEHVLRISAAALSKLPNGNQVKRQFVSWLFLKSGQGFELEVKAGSERYPPQAQHFVSTDPQKKREMGLSGRAYEFQETRVSRNAKYDPRCLNAEEENVDQAVAVPLSEYLKTDWLNDDAQFCPGVIYLGVRNGSFTKAEILFTRLFAKVLTRLLIKQALVQNWRREVREDLRNLPLLGWYIDADVHKKELIDWITSAGARDVALVMYKIGRAGDVATDVTDVVPKDVAWARMIDRTSKLINQQLEKIEMPQTNQLPLPGLEFQLPVPASVGLYQKDTMAGIAGLSQSQVLEIAAKLRRVLRTDLTIHRHLSCVRLEVLVLWLPEDYLCELADFGPSRSRQLSVEFLIDEKLSTLKSKVDEWTDDAPPILTLDCSTDRITVVAEDGGTLP